MVKKAVLEDPTLTMANKMVYVALCYFADYDTGTLKAHRKTIAVIAGCGLRTLDTAIKELETKGYVGVERQAATGKYRLSNTYTLLDFWIDTPNRRGAGDAPPESEGVGDLGGAGDAHLRGAGDAQYLNKKEEVNKKEGGANDLDTSRSRYEDNEAPPDPVPPDSIKPPGVLKTMEQVVKEAGKPWRISPEDRSNIETAVAVHGGEAVVNAWRDWLAKGEKASIRFFLEDTEYPEPKPKAAPRVVCDECRQSVPVLIQMDDEHLCEPCARKRVPPEKFAETTAILKRLAAKAKAS
jgi:hypothetical protein